MSTNPVTVGARVEAPGFHQWPMAPKHRDYLTARHRHLFVLEAEVAVEHDERDVEFHDLQDAMRGWAQGFYVHTSGAAEFGARSCETLARDLAAHLQRWGARVVSVTVSEDGESWATFTPDPTT